MHWHNDAIFYHIYPLGFCGALECNDFQSAPVQQLLKICDWIPHMRSLGVNTIYLGPVFESESHGYDTVNYYEVDRRLGTNATLRHVVQQCHVNNIRVVLDGVFHHVGREFWAFQDVRQYRECSMFTNWFSGIDFYSNSPYDDGFSYEGWNGHFNLVKLNLQYKYVVEHLLEAVRKWIVEFDIDGLRLDVADQLEFDFMRTLAKFTKELKPDFWLMGEVIHGDYARWANPDTLDSTTNYEVYKGLWSSHNDRNYFEIAYSLNRQFGLEYGIYQGLSLYNFADNHDVDRIASTLRAPAHLYPLYLLLFTIPGNPSIYYGSEWGLAGQKTPHSDQPLRPELHLHDMQHGEHADLLTAIQHFSRLHQELPALRRGSYRQLLVASEQFAFLRSYRNGHVVVAVNAEHQPKTVRFSLPVAGQRLKDMLNDGQEFLVRNGEISLEIPACWGRILSVL
jgi:glycosidase